MSMTTTAISKETFKARIKGNYEVVSASCLDMFSNSMKYTRKATAFCHVDYSNNDKGLMLMLKDGSFIEWKAI